MKDNSPGTIWPLVIIGGAVAFGLLVVCGVLFGALMFFGIRSAQVPPPPVAVTQEAVTGGPEVLPLATPTPLGGSSGGDQEPEEAGEESPGDKVDAETAAEMHEVEGVVADLRELEPLTDVPKAYLHPDEMQDVVINDFFEDYTPEEAADDAILYAALDAVDLDFDLYDFYVDLYSEGVAGFYDPAEDEFFLIGDSSDFSAGDEWTFAHEYVHALQDQHFDLETFLYYSDDDWHIDNFDESLARTALIEGDASLTSLIYVGEGMSVERQQEMWDELAEEAIPAIYERTPYFLLEDFFFPYDEGQLFVEALFAEGGFAAVDDAYRNPPTSTEQILHPERYRSGDEPLPVSLLDTLDALGPTYREVYTLPMGEWYLRLYLSQLLDVEAAQDAADGWGGDRIGVYFDDDARALAMVIRTRWDSGAEASEFASLFPRYGADWSGDDPVFEDDGLTCWQADDLLCFYQVASDDTLIVRGPDAETVSGIVDAYR